MMELTLIIVSFCLGFLLGLYAMYGYLKDVKPLNERIKNGNT